MTVLARRQFTVTDQAGNIVPNASIEVKKQLVGGQPLATLYSDRAGASPIANPFTADSNGFAYFHAAGSVYKIRAYLGPSGSPTFEQVWEYVSMGNIDELDYDTDGALAANSDVLLPTQKAVKTYVDTAFATPPTDQHVTSAGPVTVSNGAGIVRVDQTVGAAMTLNLPAAASKTCSVLICDWKGDAGTNAITVVPNGTEKIQGLSSWQIGADNGSIFLRPIPGVGYAL